MHPGRWIARLGAGLSVLIAAYLGAALALAIVPGRSAETEADRLDHEIRLLSGPIHVDLLIPLTDQSRARFDWLVPHGLDVQVPQAKWLMIGWGARAFYTHTGTYADLTPGPVVRAVMGDASVLRFDLLPEIPEEAARRIPVSAKTLDRLMHRIHNSLPDGSATDPIPDAGLTDQDLFFPSVGRFHILKTCNVWLGQTLRVAGIRFGAWTPTPYSVHLAHARFAPK